MQLHVDVTEDGPASAAIRRNPALFELCYQSSAPMLADVLVSGAYRAGVDVGSSKAPVCAPILRGGASLEPLELPVPSYFEPVVVSAWIQARPGPDAGSAWRGNYKAEERMGLTFVSMGPPASASSPGSTEATIMQEFSRSDKFFEVRPSEADAVRPLLQLRVDSVASACEDADKVPEEVAVSAHIDVSGTSNGASLVRENPAAFDLCYSAGAGKVCVPVIHAAESRVSLPSVRLPREQKLGFVEGWLVDRASPGSLVPAAVVGRTRSLLPPRCPDARSPPHFR